MNVWEIDIELKKKIGKFENELAKREKGGKFFSFFV